ncbi:MAG: hypothetical protein IJM12_05460 [Bacteroidales bacterium]|nr:hypothetical protein [Bacteroidales bacterium]
MSNITTTNGRASPSAMTPLRTIGNDFVYKRELPRKQTFENMVLSTEPKFTQKKRQNADNEDVCEDVSTFGKEKT